VTEAITVAVLGAAGRMGRTVVDAVESAPDLELVAALEHGDDVGAVAATGAQVAVDFTVPSVAEANVRSLVAQGVHAVVGTTGWTAESLARVEADLAERPGVGVLIAPNFALGAVLAMAFAARAARWFESG
jgi:4-hydroxy-tetrahydrodipicolinate reductase